MIPRGCLRAVLGCILLFAIRSIAAPDSIDALLEPIRAKSNLPALAAAVVRSNVIIAAGAVGVRKFGAPEKVTLEDKFHIGSCTKSMTATLAAMLVSEGKISWTTTIGE